MKKQTKNILIVLVILAVAYLLVRSQQQSNSKFGYTTTVNINDICEVIVSTDTLYNEWWYGGAYISWYEFRSGSDFGYYWTNIYETSNLSPIDPIYYNHQVISRNHTPLSLGYMKYGQAVKFYFKCGNLKCPGSNKISLNRYISFDYKNTYTSVYSKLFFAKNVNIIKKEIRVYITDPLIFDSNGQCNYNTIEAKADVYLNLTIQYKDTFSKLTRTVPESIKIN